MSLELLSRVLEGVVLGVVSGLYSGSILSKYTNFISLKIEVLRIIRSIDFVQEKEGVRLFNDSDVRKIPLIASDFHCLGHKEAGEEVAKIFKEINETNYKAERGLIGVDEYGKKFELWQERVRSIKQNYCVIWVPFIFRK